jgi:hypothetical protein
MTATAFCLLLVVTAARTAQAQETPAPTPSPAAAQTLAATPAERPILKTIKLTAQYAVKVPVVRKLFYLSRLPFNLDELQQKIGNLPSHQDYRKKASGPNLSEEMVAEFTREWLERYKCETVYCQPITLEDIQRIRVFQDAYKRASELFKNAPAPQGTALALKWMPNFLPPEIRTGYFDMKMDWVKRAVALMEAASVGGEKNSVRAVMTDSRGEALFPDAKPGTTYYLSNLIPIEDSQDCYLWNTSVLVKEGEFLVQGVSFMVKLKRVTVKELKGANATALTFTCAPTK